MKFFAKFKNILILMLFFLSGCSFGKSNQIDQCIPIRIGVIIADDNLESGYEQKKGYEMAFAEINQAGGIQGCPIELVYENEGEELDTQSAQVAIMQLAEQNVLAIIGGTSNEASLNAATIASYFKVPLIIPSATNDEITSKENQWIFRLRASSESDAKTAFDMVRSGFGSEARIVILYEETNYGESTAVVTASTALSMGLNVTGYYSFSNQDLDITSLVEQVNKLAPEIVYVISSDSSFATNLHGVFQTEEVSFNMMIGVGPGFSERSFLYDGNENVYENLENLIIISDWSLDLPWNGMEKFIQDFEIYSQQSNFIYSTPVLRNVETYTSLKILSSALNQINLRIPKRSEGTELSTDELSQIREELASALRNLDANHRETLFGPISFDGAGQNRQSSILVQVVNGNIVTIYPPRYAKQSPVLNFGW